MLRWAFVENYGTEEYIHPANSGREAVAMAEETWNRLTDAEKKRAKGFCVGLYNLDKAGNYMEQEDGSIDADGRTVIYDRLNDIPVEGCISPLSAEVSLKSRINNILDCSGMKMAEFSRAFGIPYRSLYNWVGGEREAPNYVLDMLEKVVWEYRECVTRGVTL
jgi:hypothetical protein